MSLLKIDHGVEPGKLAGERDVTDTQKESNAQRVREDGRGTGFKKSIRRFKDIRKRWERNVTLNSEIGRRPSLIY